MTVEQKMSTGIHFTRLESRERESECTRPPRRTRTDEKKWRIRNERYCYHCWAILQNAAAAAGTIALWGEGEGNRLERGGGKSGGGERSGGTGVECMLPSRKRNAGYLWKARAGWAWIISLSLSDEQGSPYLCLSRSRPLEWCLKCN